MKPLKEVDRYEIAPGHYRDYEKSHPAYRSKWRKAKKEVLLRDKYTCQDCGITQEELLENPTGVTVKDYLNVCHLGKKEELEMLITLCWNCHKKIDGVVTIYNDDGKATGHYTDKKLRDESRAKLHQRARQAVAKLHLCFIPFHHPNVAIDLAFSGTPKRSAATATSSIAMMQRAT